MKLKRRDFVKNCAVGCGGLLLGVSAFDEMVLDRSRGRITLGFRNDAPAELGPHAREAMYWRKVGELVTCELCPHHCTLGENDRGYCRARVVKGGKLHTLDWANPCALQLDPIEKKPFFHFKPKSSVVSLACAGCNMRCLNCQNWEISQARPGDVDARELLPADLVALTLDRDSPSIAYTYTEPVIYYEYAYESAKLARAAGLNNVMVTAGFVEAEPLRRLCTVIDAVTLDIKAFSEKNYTRISTGRLQPVLDGILTMKKAGVWLELSTLVVPTLSDDVDEIAAMCRWIVREVGPDVPMHLLRFQPQFMLKALPATPLETLVAGREAARAAGLNYVYLGNVPGRGYENTLCPKCNELLIKRTGYHIEQNSLVNGRCPRCAREIAGVWS